MLSAARTKRSSWTAEDDASLRRSIEALVPVDVIAKGLFRTVAAFERRMNRLKIRRVRDSSTATKSGDLST